MTTVRWCASPGCTYPPVWGPWCLECAKTPTPAPTPHGAP